MDQVRQRDKFLQQARGVVLIRSKLRVGLAQFCLTTIIALQPLVGEAQTRTESWKTCENGEPNESILACTAIIRRALAEANRISPKELSSAFNNLGAAYGRGDQLDLAIDNYNNAIQLAPDNVYALRNRGSIFILKGDADRAISDFTAAYRLSPDDSTLLRNRAAAYFFGGLFDPAVEDFKSALKVKPSDPALYRNRGITFFAMGRFSDAVNDFSRCLEIDSLDPYAVLWLHLARGRSGHNDEKEFVRNASKLDPTKWPWSLISHSLGKFNVQKSIPRTENATMKVQRKESCETSFYLGEEALIRADVARALPLLKDASNSCPPSFFEFSVVRAELKTMEK